MLTWLQFCCQWTARLKTHTCTFVSTRSETTDRRWIAGSTARGRAPDSSSDLKGVGEEKSYVQIDRVSGQDTAGEKTLKASQNDQESWLHELRPCLVSHDPTSGLEGSLSLTQASSNPGHLSHPSPSQLPCLAAHFHFNVPHPPLSAVPPALPHVWLYSFPLCPHLPPPGSGTSARLRQPRLLTLGWEDGLSKETVCCAAGLRT